MRSLLNGHIQETVWCANAAKSRRYSSVTSMRSMHYGHIQETFWCANAATSRRYSSVSSMRSLPDGHIQETVWCANAAKSRRYSRVKVVPFQAEGFSARTHPVALVGRRILNKCRKYPDSLKPDLNPTFQANLDPFSRVLMTKNWKIQLEIFLNHFFILKIAIYLSLGLHKRRPS